MNKFLETPINGEIDKDGVDTASYRSPNKGSQIERETQGTWGDHCKSINCSKKPTEQGRLA